MKQLFKISALSLGITFTGAASAVDLCNVTYQAQSNWGSGAQLQITVVNNGTNINNPTLSWNYSGSESLVSFWNASSVTQSGKTFTVVDNGNVSTGGAFDFNIIINNPGAVPSDFLLNGASCKTVVGTGSSTSSSVQIASSIKSSSASSKASAVNSSSSSVVVTNTAAWILDDSTSMLNMVTVKNKNTAEVGSFSGLQGSVDKDGLAIVKIDLNTVSTANTIRDGRIRDFLFETNLLPTLYYKVQLNLSDIAAIASGSSTIQTLNGSLTLHGATSNISAQVLITKLANNQIIVSSYKPVLVTASSFDLEWGIDYLRKIRTDEGFPVSAIGYTVPIYFNLHFNSSTTSPSITMPSAPNPALDLKLIDNTFGKVTANWVDGSSNETAFLVRRNINNGKWQKIQSLPSGSNMLEDLINETGIYNYKVIALNGSVPSSTSPVAQVNVGKVDVDLYTYGKTTYADKCAGCHGSEAKGSGPYPALNIKPTAEHEALMIKKIVAEMPPGGTFKCDEDCAAAIIVFLKKDFWDKPVEPVACEAPVNYGARQLRLLTKIEYQNTVNALFGNGFNVDTTAPDALVGNFINNTKKAITKSDYDQYLITAEKVAKWAAGNNFVNVVSCNNNFDSSCATKFINEFAPKAIRRKLDSAEITAFTSMANGSKTNGDVKAGIQLALEAILGSPQFLYRHEIGEKNSANTAIASDAFELTSYEMATWLAYTYTASTPDATLLQKAADNKLRTEAEIRTEIARLVQSSQLKDKLGNFVNSWLSTETLSNTNKDATAYPGVNFDSLIPLMQTELSLFFSDLMLDSNGKFQTLYNANYTYVNGPLANHYKIPGVSGDGFVRVSTSNRGGLIANGGFMSRWADPKEPSPIRRAVRIRDRLLCQTIPEIPAGVLEAREQLSEEHKQEIEDVHTTNRRKFQILTGLTACDSCHKEIINPLGFGLEDFDSVGNPRTIDTRGNMIVASGALYAPQAWNRAYVGTVTTFTGAKDLGSVMAEEPQAQKCLTQNIFRISLGLGEEDKKDYIKDENEAKGYSCEATKLKNTMMAQSPRKMLEQLGVMDSVRYRKAWSR